MSRFQVGDRVESGANASDFDTGTVVSVDPLRIRWDEAGLVYDEADEDESIRPAGAAIGTCSDCGAICSACVRRRGAR